MTTITDEFCRMRLILAHDLLASADTRFGALQELTAMMSQPDVPIVDWDFTDTIVGAIKLELSKSAPERSEFLLCELLRELRTRRHAEAIPVLSAIADNYGHGQVSKLAQEALVQMAPSLQRLWDETLEDQVSDVQSRATRLEHLRKMELTPMETILGIFNEMKAMPVTAPTDPRLSAVNEYLVHENAEVRAAATFALLQCT